MNEDPISRLSRLDTCALSDALDQLRLPGAVAGIAPKTVVGRIAGRVLTVKLLAGQAKEGAPHLGARAIEAAEPGDVIVVEQASGLDAAGWGGILSNAAKARGVAGVIVEGPARDIDEAAAIAFPVFARSATTRTARGRIYEAATGEPISVGGAAVEQGDFVAADQSGVVFIAAANLEAVVTAAERIASREAAMTKAITVGARVSAVMGASYESMLEEGAQ